MPLICGQLFLDKTNPTRRIIYNWVLNFEYQWDGTAITPILPPSYPTAESFFCWHETCLLIPSFINF